MRHAEARFFIVDDEPSIRMSLSHVLTEMGYRVRTAEDGFSALAELREEVPTFFYLTSTCPACPASSCS
jgi:DNA-binding NtrC family response regulator